MYDRLLLVLNASPKIPPPQPDTADILINGRNLIDIVREIEQPFANREGHPDGAGNYQGLPARVIFFPSQHLLGDPLRLYSNKRGQTQLLQCTCGEAGCWPLLARITVEDDRVTWDQFSQPYRGPNSRASHWQYDALKPFVFERSAYEAALAPPQIPWPIPAF